jgi:hypothetical protein
MDVNAYGAATRLDALDLDFRIGTCPLAWKRIWI